MWVINQISKCMYSCSDNKMFLLPLKYKMFFALLLLIIYKLLLFLSYFIYLYNNYNNNTTYETFKWLLLLWTVTITTFYYFLIFVTNPVYELLFIHHQRSLVHHIDSCTTLTVAGHPRTTVPIIHCTDDAHTTDCTDHTQLIPICTLFISLGLSLCDRRVLYSVYHSPSDSYSTEPT